LEAIMDKLHDDVRPIMRGFRDTRDDVAKLLGAATIDREAAEKLRAERIAAVDEASRKLTSALLDAAEVLTAEQRAELVEHFEDRGWHRRW
ncbi:MAG: periplasmic heavy metal sensor, partial [Mesorhizobium sp.]